MSWARLFERADEYDVTVADVRGALARVRDRESEEGAPAEGSDDPAEASPARVVADADVLAADLLVGGAPREALDAVREHSWVALVASDALLTDAEAVVAELADPALAADWRERVEREREGIVHPAGDHPALASAYRGGAMQVLTFDDGLRTASAGAAIRGRVETSVKHPRAFAAVFDAAALHEAVEGSAYPGPDRDPRA